MTNYDIVKRIIGCITPQGDCSIDERRYDSLEQTIELVDKLMFDISMVAAFRDSHEGSVSKAGKLAHKFMIETKEV
jgi:hypothetical protein